MSLLDEEISLPENSADFKLLKEKLIVLGVRDRPEVWYTVASHIQKLDSTVTKCSYAYLVNAARKLLINEVAQEEKVLAGLQIEAKLKEATERASHAFKEAEASNGRDHEIPEADGSDLSARAHRL